jgi:hypothetical protein
MKLPFPLLALLVLGCGKPKTNTVYYYNHPEIVVKLKK